MNLGTMLGDGRRELLVEFLTGWFRPQTWRSAFYLLLALPLGIAYFTFLVTGFSLAGGLIVIYVGFPVLALTLFVARQFCLFEARLANESQGTNIVLPRAPWTGGGSLWARTKRTVLNMATWKGVFFLFVMFPVGIATFTITVTMVSVAFWAATIPIWVPFYDWNDWDIPGTLQAVITVFLFVVGVLLVLASPHIINLMADGRSRFAHSMLSDPAAAEWQRTQAEEAPTATQSPEVHRERAARLHVLAIKSVYIHATLFAAVNALLLLIDLVTGGGLWFYWSIIGWGVGLAVHAAAVYLPFLGGEWDKKKTEELLQDE